MRSKRESAKRREEGGKNDSSRSTPTSFPSSKVEPSRRVATHKSAPMVALYWFENFLLTYWFMSDVFPTLERGWTDRGRKRRGGRWKEGERREARGGNGREACEG